MAKVNDDGTSGRKHRKPKGYPGPGRLILGSDRTSAMLDVTPGRARKPGQRHPHFDLYRSRSRWRWRLRAANGEIIASGEAFNSKAAALASIDLIRRLAPMALLRKLF